MSSAGDRISLQLHLMQPQTHKDRASSSSLPSILSSTTLSAPDDNCICSRLLSPCLHARRPESNVSAIVSHKGSKFFSYTSSSQNDAHITNRSHSRSQSKEDSFPAAKDSQGSRRRRGGNRWPKVLFLSRREIGLFISRSVNCFTH